MNHARRVAGGVALMVGAGVAHMAGCVFPADYADCNIFPHAGCSDGGLVAGCDPSKSAGPVADTCGVFVSPTGNDGNPGTKEKPLNMIGVALGKGTAVYACAGAIPFSEAVTVPAGATVFGGLDCASWNYVGATIKTTITAGAGQVPVTLAMGSGEKLADLHVLAADVSTMSDGTSSIAVVANGATAELDGCVIEAQGAAAGATGKGYTGAAQAGGMGMNGSVACMASITLPGASASSGCATMDSTSGLGGVGSVTSGGAGSPGSPGSTMNGGAGEGAAVCTPGTVGDSGMPGKPAQGATGLGSFAGGNYTGVAGTDGKPGGPGQGGGGGGGAKGGSGANQCTVASMAGGASGGSGGSGGCGGAGGKGGGFGGSSIALVSLNATLTLANVTLKAGNGGAGGDGGLGQGGGSGGMAGVGGTVPVGSSLNPGCAGGSGGTGGTGGKGGGGKGGHSLGIAVTGTAPSTSGRTVMTSTPGVGGKGDDTMGNMGDGAAGTAANCWDFVANAACK